MVKTDIKIITFLLDKLAEEVWEELRLGECSRCDKPCEEVKFIIQKDRKSVV